jgi:hypothetical protein
VGDVLTIEDVTLNALGVGIGLPACDPISLYIKN